MLVELSTKREQFDLLVLHQDSLFEPPVKILALRPSCDGLRNGFSSLGCHVVTSNCQTRDHDFSLNNTKARMIVDKRG
jgi:hypothetical protein